MDVWIGVVVGVVCSLSGFEMLLSDPQGAEMLVMDIKIATAGSSSIACGSVGGDFV